MSISNGDVYVHVCKIKSAINMFCQDRGNEVSFYRTIHYTNSVLYVCFVRYLVVAVVAVVVVVREKT
jgi:hypothetical protein